MLQAQNLAARRGEALLFSNLSLFLAPGSALIISGPNGSGKTTLLRILAGLTQPEAGTLTWRDVRTRAFDARLRKEGLFVGHLPALKDELTALENLASLARLHGADSPPRDLLDALAAWGLSRQRNLPARVLSQGQRKRVGLARLRLPRRRLWLLDEPATALDDGGIAILCATVIAHLAAGGMAAIATHQPLALPPDATAILQLS